MNNVQSACLYIKKRITHMPPKVKTFQLENYGQHLSDVSLLLLFFYRALSTYFFNPSFLYVFFKKKGGGKKGKFVKNENCLCFLIRFY